MTNTFITFRTDKYTQYIHDTVVYDNYMYYIHIYPRTVSTIHDTVGRKCWLSKYDIGRRCWLNIVRLKTTIDIENDAVRVFDHVDVANITFENSDHIRCTSSTENLSLWRMSEVVKNNSQGASALHWTMLTGDDSDCGFAGLLPRAGRCRTRN